jgi:4-hydroxy-tetrahydrodipicolinate synthase
MKKGVFTLLITPFRSDYSIDEAALRLLVQRQVASQIDGIAPLGVTGENSLLTNAEVRSVLKIVVEEVDGKKPVMPDICLAGTRESIDRAKMYADTGASYAVAYSPFLILPTASALIKYFEQLADASPIPIILHNSKNRTGVELTPEMTAQLAKHPNIVGTKDGNKLIDHLASIVYLTRNDDFLVFTGKDTTAYPLVAFGGAGSFSVVGNIIPDIMARMIHFTLEGNHEKARELHLDYYPLFEACRFETNPMGAKKALELMGLIDGSLRPPMTRLNESNTAIMSTILRERGLI